MKGWSVAAVAAKNGMAREFNDTKAEEHLQRRLLAGVTAWSASNYAHTPSPSGTLRRLW